MKAGGRQTGKKEEEALRERMKKEEGEDGERGEDRMEGRR